MALTLRLQKGTDLTHQELDDNFSELDQRISEKANATHTHGISEISGLQDALDDKIDVGDTNVPNGLLLLGADGKVPCELLKDCFDVASKVSSSDLYGTDGKIKPEHLPASSGGGGCECEIADIPELQAALDNKANVSQLCDCTQINTDIQALQNELNALKSTTTISDENTSISDSDRVVVLDPNANISVLDIAQVSDGAHISILNLTANSVQFSENYTSAGQSINVLQSGHSVRILRYSGQWFEIK